ncbi:MAG TPA: MATE family efflux transporter [Candidatus Marinimicrobia bacterium]|nr:MATE family efflux transporter [Candidatus Neomarinimicrobiota bacterium]
MIQESSRLNEFLNNPEKGLWKLALPVMAGMGIQTLYTIVDMIFIGRLSGEAIAAVAFNMPLFFFVLGLTMGLGSGVTASIARFIGAKDKVNADNSAEHAVVIGIGISIILTTLGFVYGRDILMKIGATESVIDLSWSYLRVICIGLPFMVLSAFFRSILTGEGDTKFPMTVAALGTILNIILDPIFIFTLGLGVAGAAWATAISQIIVFIIFVYMLFVKEHSYITFRLKDFKPSSFIMKDIIKVGLPASISMVIMSFGQLVFNRILVHFSTDAVAAYQVGGRIDMVIFLPIMSIAFGLTTLVGMFHGAQELDKVKYIIKYGLTRSFLITTVISIIVYVFAPQLIMGFTKDIYIQNAAVKYLRLMSIVYPLIATAMPCGRILQGFGLGMPMLIITAVRVLLISSPLALFFVFVQNRPLEWIWYSMMISTGVSFVVAVSWLVWALKKYSAKQIEI